MVLKRSFVTFESPVSPPERSLFDYLYPGQFKNCTKGQWLSALTRRSIWLKWPRHKLYVTFKSNGFAQARNFSQTSARALRSMLALRFKPSAKDNSVSSSLVLPVAASFRVKSLLSGKPPWSSSSRARSSIGRGANTHLHFPVSVPCNFENLLALASRLFIIALVLYNESLLG
jgi:hypothetical protein